MVCRELLAECRHALTVVPALLWCQPRHGLVSSKSPVVPSVCGFAAVGKAHAL